MTVLDGHDPQAIRQAAARWAEGGLVAFPTETVYGLGARADDDAAVARIFSAKGRPADHPLIVHVADEDSAQAYAAQWPPAARALAQRFWPGPVTLIVPRRPGVAEAAAGGHPSIGLRSPDHPVAQALLREAAALGVSGVAGPSANRFGRVSPTCARHVEDEFGPGLWVVDGGDCREGIESSIVDCTSAVPALLRPGTTPRALIESALHQAAGLTLKAADRHSAAAPGMLASHYAPAAPVHLASADELPQRVAAALEEEARAARTADAHHADSADGADRADRADRADGKDGAPHPRPSPVVGVYSRTPLPPAAGLAQRALPDNPAETAHELFAVLRRFDAQGVHQIWVETPPAHAEWDGVRDRLRRAATR